MGRVILLLLVPMIILASCKEMHNLNIADQLEPFEYILGKPENTDFLYTTAGPKIYSIGSQGGQFPEIGFHVPGEMGGIWLHPIKLLDGFRTSVVNLDNNKISNLDNADTFKSYPMASQFEYKLEEENLHIVRTDFVIDQIPVLVIEYKIKNISKENKTIGLELDIDSDLSPVWLGAQNGMKDGRDFIFEIDSLNNFLLIKDSLSSWFAGIGFDGGSFSCVGKQKSCYTGKGITVNLSHNVFVNSESEEIIRLYISGSTENENIVKTYLVKGRDELNDFVKQKINRYKEIDMMASISIPDKDVEQIYRWGKYNIDWLVREVDGLGRGISAGLPDYPWFFSNDQSSTINAILGTRDASLFIDSWNMLKRESDKFNGYSGRIIHEMSSNGSVYDKGRMEESQEFIITAWNIFTWTGDLEFLKTYYEHGKKVWEFLLQHDKNKNLYIEGYGGTEIEGLNDEMLDVAVYTQCFLEVMSKMAKTLGKEKESEDYMDKAIILKRQINDDWWIEDESRFGDFISSKDKAIKLIDVALSKRVDKNRNMWAKNKLLNLKRKIEDGTYANKSYAVFYNTTGILPLSEGIADKQKADKMLSKIDFFTNKYGMYITGIERPDDIGLDEGSVAFRRNEFNYNQAIMPLATSKLILSAANYSTPDKTLDYMRMLVNNFSYATPGTTYEVSPDYGMFVQAWNVSGINIPIIHHFFGVVPMAIDKYITLSPNMPSKWGYAKLENLLIGNTKLSVDFKKDCNKSVYIISCSEPGWKIEFNAPADVRDICLDGNKVLTDKIILSKQVHKIEFINK